MMAAALLLMTAQVAPPAAVPSVEQEIVVIAQRLRNVRFKMKRDRRTRVGSCRISRSSGDPAIDRLVCDAAVTCMGTAKVQGAVFYSCLTDRWKGILQTRREQLQAARDEG